MSVEPNELEAGVLEALASVEDDASLENAPEPHLALTEMSLPQWRVYCSKKKITLAVAGIRGGKTHIGALKMLHYAMEHPTAEDEVHLILSPTYPMSRVPIEKMFKLLNDKALFPVNPLIRFQRSQRAFKLIATDGKTTTVIVRSAHDPDRLRGLKVLSVWIDEAAYCSEYAWEIVQGRLADVDGPAWITTTPNGYNWVFDLYEKAKQGDKNIRVVWWPSTANKHISQEGIAGLAANYDVKTHDQEVKARFVKGRGLIYYPFRRSIHIHPWKLNPKAELIVGQDFNVDPMASVLMQRFRTSAGEDGLHILAAWRENDSSTYKLAVRMHDFLAQHRMAPGQVTFFPDASGGARSTSGKSDFKILRDAGFNISAPPKNPPVKDRINCVNGLLAPMNLNGTKRPPRLLVDASAVDVIETFEKQIWAPDTDPPVPDKSKGHDHHADAVGYPCHRLFPLRAGNVIGRQAFKQQAVAPFIRRKVG